MAKLLKLVHPRLGLVATQVAHSNHFTKFKTAWKYRYGKKYEECFVEITEIDEPEDRCRNYFKA